MPRHEARLLVMEGPDGVGKTTVSKAVASALTAQGVNAAWRSFPGSTAGTLGELVYRLHHSPTTLGIDRISPVALQCLHTAAHLDSIDRDIGPLLVAGATVILDRYWWSTWVYGRRAGSPEAVIDLLVAAERERWGALCAGTVFLLTREETSRGDIELTSLYQELARREAVRCRVVHVRNEASIADVTAFVLSQADDESSGSHS